MPNIKLQSLDGEVFEVDAEIAKQSVTIKTMLEGKETLKQLHALSRNIHIPQSIIFQGFLRGHP